jgi:toxin ParE1/3/4
VKLVEWTPRARQDASDAADWYARQGGLVLADGFLDELEAAVQRIASFPEAGSTLHAHLFPELTGRLRFFRVQRFERYLVYYIDHPERLAVVRIWDASRGLQALMNPGDPRP